MDSLNWCLEIAPEGVLKKRFSAVRPILEIAGEAVKVCLLPIPWYVKSSCCGDEKHIINLHEDDFEDILMGAASSCRNVIAGEGEKAGLSLYTFDPVAAFGGGQKLAAKTSSAGLSVWQENDPVHLTSAALRTLQVSSSTRLAACSLVLLPLVGGASTASSQGFRSLAHRLSCRCLGGSAARKWSGLTVAEAAEGSGGTAAEATATALTPTDCKWKYRVRNICKVGRILFFY